MLPSGSYWNWICECVGGRAFAAPWLWLLEKLAAPSAGATSSLVSGWIIWAMTGWFFLFCMVVVSAWMKAPGVFTNSWASASGLSSTMAMSISPPSFLMRAGLPACICSRIATALFSHRFRSHSSMARCASDPVCGGIARSAGVPSAARNARQAVWQLA